MVGSRFRWYVLEHGVRGQETYRMGAWVVGGMPGEGALMGYQYTGWLDSRMVFSSCDCSMVLIDCVYVHDREKPHHPRFFSDWEAPSPCIFCSLLDVAVAEDCLILPG